jgi:uracil-DNA glycosylase family 4
VPKLGSSPYKRLVSDWEKCTKCPLCKSRNKVVFAKGKMPCDVLLIGEAPGQSEDVIGVPFIGPAGKLLDEMVNQAKIDGEGQSARVAFFNLVGCVPKEEDSKRKRGEPLPTEIEACYSRLEQFLKIAKPTAIVCVGELASKQAKMKGWDKRFKVSSIYHPAFILRLDITQKGLAIQRTIVQLADVFQDLVPF